MLHSNKLLLFQLFLKARTYHVTGTGTGILHAFIPLILQKLSFPFDREIQISVCVLQCRIPSNKF